MNRGTTAWAAISVLCAGAGLGGCKTAGTVTGDVHKKGQAGGEPVVMMWQSDGGSVTQGTMTATLPGGETYSGPYLQVTSDTSETTMGPMWVGWDEGWGGWGPNWGMAGPSQSFGTIYSGRVVANLSGNQGDRMRCRFLLASPSSGMAGGGQGECQTSTNQIINGVIHDGVPTQQ